MPIGVLSSKEHKRLEKLLVAKQNEPFAGFGFMDAK
jgi:hypothetical protein